MVSCHAGVILLEIFEKVEKSMKPSI